MLIRTDSSHNGQNDLLLLDDYQDGELGIGVVDQTECNQASTRLCADQVVQLRDFLNTVISKRT